MQRAEPMPRDVEPMLATLVDQAFTDAAWVFEPKYDGVRCLAYVRTGGIELVTRRGNEVAFRYPDLRSLPEHVKGEALLDGEIITFDESGHPNFQQLQQDRKSTRLNSSHVAISYAVFCLKKKK